MWFGLSHCPALPMTGSEITGPQQLLVVPHRSSGSSRCFSPVWTLCLPLRSAKPPQDQTWKDPRYTTYDVCINIPDPTRPSLTAGKPSCGDCGREVAPTRCGNKYCPKQAAFARDACLKATINAIPETAFPSFFTAELRPLACQS